jgi:hypothetical protein
LVLRETHFFFRLASIKNHNTTKDLGLGPVSGYVSKTSWVLLRISICWMRKRGRRRIIEPPLLYVLFFFFQNLVSPVLVELVFMCPFIEIVDVGANLMTSDSYKLY